MEQTAPSIPIAGVRIKAAIIPVITAVLLDLNDNIDLLKATKE